MSTSSFNKDSRFSQPVNISQSYMLLTVHPSSCNMACLVKFDLNAEIAVNENIQQFFTASCNYTFFPLNILYAYEACTEGVDKRIYALYPSYSISNKME